MSGTFSSSAKRSTPTPLLIDFFQICHRKCDMHVTYCINRIYSISIPHIHNTCEQPFQKNCPGATNPRSYPRYRPAGRPYPGNVRIAFRNSFPRTSKLENILFSNRYVSDNSRLLQQDSGLDTMREAAPAKDSHLHLQAKFFAIPAPVNWAAIP